MTHLGPRCLSGGQTIDAADWRSLSKFCWSWTPEGKLIIFVHGFGGDALTTWSEFVTQWPGTHKGWDLAFFGYPTARLKINDFKLDKLNVDEHANSFLQFLNTIETSPADTINKSLETLIWYMPELRRERNFTYSHIVLVAHSLGAVICRRALVQESKAKWVSKCRLILFAPAHKGAKPLMLINALTGISWGNLFANTIDYFMPILEDLNPKKDYLPKLEALTEDLIKGGAEKPFIATHVIWAVPDDVVVNKYFAKDGRAEEVQKVSHSGVCKPTPEWDQPLKEVTTHIS